MKAGWQSMPLATVCQIKPPKAEARQRLSGNGLVSFVPMEDLGIDQKILVPKQTKPLEDVISSYTYFADGDVLLAKITPCFENGKLGIADALSNGIGFGSSEYIVFRPSPILDKEWLYYFLSRQTFRDEGTARMSGAVGHKRVSKDFIESCRIPVPPIPEQHRIVAILEEAFDGIATAIVNAEQNIHNARALFESHLQDVFRGGVNGWVETKMGQVCNFVRGPFGGSLKKSIFVPDGYAVYEQQHAIYDQFNEIRYFVDETKFNEMRRFELLPNDLIMSCSGTMGRVAIVPEGIKKGIINQALLKLTPSDRVLAMFLKYWMESQVFQDEINEHAGGAAIQNVASVKILKEIQIPLPPVSEQKVIVSQLENISRKTQRLEFLYREKLTALNSLKESLLHQAFSGAL